MSSLPSDLSASEISRRLQLAYSRSSAPTFADTHVPDDLLKGSPRSAAVLIPLFQADNSWHMLFTRRHHGLAEHSGQVAFPGGQSERGDVTPEETALREAQEEIGISPSDVVVLGRMRDFLTVTNYLVTPVVGQIPWPYEFRLEEGEVSRVFSIPLAWLADRTNYELQLREISSLYQPMRVVFFKPYDGEILWGASASITLVLMEILQEAFP